MECGCGGVMGVILWIIKSKNKGDEVGRTGCGIMLD
jgi:hypothetical protein